MAKKKQSNAHQEKPSKKQEDSVKPGAEIANSMDSEAVEKLESLKSLNQLLLKEAFERRQQVESLVQSRGSLESEVARANSEKEALRTELTRLGERAASLELERSVVDAFVAVQVEEKMKGLEMENREMKLGISGKEIEISRLTGKLSEIEDALANEREVSRRVCVDRDDLGIVLSRETERVKGLKEKLTEFGDIKREIDELRASYDAALGEKGDLKMRMKSVMGERDSMEKGLVEANAMIEKLKEQLVGIVKEKEGIEEEKKVEKIKNRELENALSGVNEIVADLQKEEAKLRKTVVEFEKKVAEGEGRQEEMDALVEETKMDKERIRSLIDEKDVIEKELGESLKKVAEQKGEIQELVEVREWLMEAKGGVDDEVKELENELAELKAVVSKLQEGNLVGLEKIKSLESEVGEYNSKLEKAKVERGGMERSLKAEKENVVSLKEKMAGLESKIEESYKMLEKVKAEKSAIFYEKTEVESRCEELKTEVASLQKAMNEGRNELKSVKDKAALADAKSELVLKMVKKTAAFCLKDGFDDGGEFVDNGGDQTKEFAMELETIKKAFKTKDGKVEEVKKEMGLLEEDAKKKRSFWTMVSSATTLLAAVSVAYAARGGR